MRETIHDIEKAIAYATKQFKPYSVVFTPYEVHRLLAETNTIKVHKSDDGEYYTFMGLRVIICKDAPSDKVYVIDKETSKQILEQEK